MTETVVQDWLKECTSLSSGQLPSYSAVLDHNEELVTAIQTVLEERSRFPNLLDAVCNQLFIFYRSKESALQRFTLQFLPCLMYVHVAAVASGEKKSCKSIETLLLGIYNLAVVNESDEPVVFAFRLPSLAQNSLYHDTTIENITAAALRRFEEVNTKPITWGPHPQIELVNAQNRLTILTALQFVFNRHIATFQKSALKNLCRVSSKIVMQGFPRPGHHQRSSSFGGETNYLPKLPPRIPISSQFLLELTSGLYFAMFNDFGQMAMQAIEDIHHRSCYQCLSDVLLVTNAIKNSSHYTGQTAEGAMPISVALSPATTTVTTVNKSMITNASFRTKKLPDDLDPLECAIENLTMGMDQLTSEVIIRKRGPKRKGWSWLPATPEEKSPLNIRRCSEILFVPPQTLPESIRLLGSDSPKRRVLVSAKANQIRNSPNRLSAGPRLYDIPIVSGEEGSSSAGDGSQLVSISEEKEEEPSNFTPRAASIRGKDAVTKNLQKLGIGKKPKTKTNTEKEKSSSSDKKMKSVKLSIVHNGDMSDTTDSSQVVKRRSTGENGDAINSVDVGTPDSLEPTENHSTDDHSRRLDISPTAHKKILEFEDKPLMQVSSV